MHDHKGRAQVGSHNGDQPDVGGISQKIGDATRVPVCDQLATSCCPIKVSEAPAHEGKSRTMSMHADEESDEGVVPMKRSNNEGVSSAETVEGRASPKGNGGRRAGAGTARRDAASNGLAAVRQAARQSKTVRFTAL